MSKNKKGKKKEDLDAILAELGIEEKREDQVQENEGKQGEEENAQISKSKKRKEKLKQKKEQSKLKENDAGVAEPEVVKEEPKGEEKDGEEGENNEANKETKPETGISAAAKAAAERLRLLKEYEEKQKEEERRKREEEEERIRKEEEEKEKKRLARLEKKMQLKKEGKLLSAKAKEEKKKRELYLQTLKESGMLIEPKEKVKAEIINLDLNKAKLLLKKKKNKQASGGGNNANADDKNKEVKEKENKDKESDNAEKEEEKEVVLDDWEDFLNMDDDDKKKNEKNNTDPKSKENKQNQIVKKGSATDKKGKKQKNNKNSEHNEDKDNDKTDDEEDMYRSSIVCILGHVDTGKTKLLDKLRHTNVQDNEAGGITQQIGATFFPKDILDKEIKKIDGTIKCLSKGIMIIDTPGHESFYNLRKRGSSLCDIAILVIDLMHGLEQQTKESIQILKQRNCPFVIALNKIDRLYMWEQSAWEPFNNTFKKQKEYVKEEFNNRLQTILNELSEQGLNCQLYWENKNPRKYVSIVPTSAITGEGIADLIMVLVKLTQSFMLKNIEYNKKLECTVLEVKNIEGLGTTIDVILTNGVLKESDTLVLCGMNGPIVTVARALLTPQPLKELRIKNEYIHHKTIKACIGVKISANGLEEVLCGTSLFVANNNDEIEEYKKKVMTDVSDVFNHVDKSGVGLYVMASTLGSLEALLIFLNDSKIPVFSVNIGTVQKKDVKKASIMREKGKPEYSVILAFDVKIDPEAEKEAQILGVEIMQKDIIYHLFDAFTAYLKKIEDEKKQSKMADAIFPCEVSIISDCVFNKKDPIVVGVKIEAGILKIGTPLYIPEKNLKIGNVVSIESNKKSCSKAKKGEEVCVKIAGEPNVTYGRHFDFNQKIYSKITRESIDVLKQYFRNELTMDDWRLVVQLKKILNIL